MAAGDNASSGVSLISNYVQIWTYILSYFCSLLFPVFGGFFNWFFSFFLNIIFTFQKGRYKWNCYILSLFEQKWFVVFFVSICDPFNSFISYHFYFKWQYLWPSKKVDKSKTYALYVTSIILAVLGVISFFVGFPIIGIILGIICIIAAIAYVQLLFLYFLLFFIFQKIRKRKIRNGYKKSGWGDIQNPPSLSLSSILLIY